MSESAELARLRREVLQLKADRDRRVPTWWSLRSRRLVQEVISLTGFLEDMSGPGNGVAYDGSGGGTAPSERPQPGLAQKGDRLALEAWLKALDRAIYNATERSRRGHDKKRKH